MNHITFKCYINNYYTSVSNKLKSQLYDPDFLHFLSSLQIILQNVKNKHTTNLKETIIFHIMSKCSPHFVNEIHDPKRKNLTQMHCTMTGSIDNTLQIYISFEILQWKIRDPCPEPSSILKAKLLLFLQNKALNMQISNKTQFNGPHEYTNLIAQRGKCTHVSAQKNFIAHISFSSQQVKRVWQQS